MATAEHESQDCTKTAVSKQHYAYTKFCDMTITEWIDGSSNRNLDPTESWGFMLFGSAKRRLAIWQALRWSNNQNSRLNTVIDVLKHLVAKFKDENIWEFEVVHIVADSKWTRGLVMKGYYGKKQHARISGRSRPSKKTHHRSEVRCSFVDGDKRSLETLLPIVLQRRAPASRSKTIKLKSTMPVAILR